MDNTTGSQKVKLSKLKLLKMRSLAPKAGVNLLGIAKKLSAKKFAT